MSSAADQAGPLPRVSFIIPTLNVEALLDNFLSEKLLRPSNTERIITDINIATEHPEFLDWKWVDPRSLPDLIVPFKKQLYADVLKEFTGVIAGLRPRGR